MEQRNVAEQSLKAGRIAAREKIEKSEPLFTIAVMFGVGVVMLLRATWEHDIFDMILYTVFFLVAAPALFLWRHKRSRPANKGRA